MYVGDKKTTFFGNFSIGNFGNYTNVILGNHVTANGM